MLFQRPGQSDKIKMVVPGQNIPVIPAVPFPPGKHAVQDHNLPVMAEYWIHHE